MGAVEVILDVIVWVIVVVMVEVVVTTKMGHISEVGQTPGMVGAGQTSNSGMSVTPGMRQVSWKVVTSQLHPVLFTVAPPSPVPSEGINETHF